MRLLSIPEIEYNKYKLDVIFDGYKWDPQYLDNNTIARHVLVITDDEHNELESLTEKLYHETFKAELVLKDKPELTKPLTLPRKIRKELVKIENYQAEQHIRLMRFDFHPTLEDKWAISEVNSDVPGGFAEASMMPKIACRLFSDDSYKFKDFGEVITEAIIGKVKSGGKIMLVHCTSFSDDRQAMQFLGEKLKSQGFQIIYAAADHLQFDDYKAISILDSNEGEVDAIFRFTPLEWLVNMKPKRWSGYFDTVTTSCNHPIAIFAQTKRFPLIWEALEKHGADLSAWRQLLPETVEVSKAKNNDDFIYKPVYGRVGEGISIKEACKADEYSKILKDVKKKPKKYMAQKRFNSKVITDDEGNGYHVCLGSYCVDGKAAGYYARISDKPRIDSGAADIPVLIERGAK